MSTTSKLDKALKESFAAVDYIREKCEAVTKIVKKYKLFDEKSTIDVLEAVFARVEEMKEQWDENKAYFERNEDYRLKFKPTAKAIIKMADVLRKCKFGGQQYRGSKQVAKLVDSIVLNSTPIHFVQNNGAPPIPGASEISPDEIQIDREIGQGSFGKVYLGLYNGATVALKFATTMPPEDFKREIKIMGKIKPHPNIIQLYGYSHDKNTKSPIIVLEYCPNGSLEEYRKKHGIVDIKTMTEMLHSIALGLHHLHNANIVHRDLGARNILLNKDVCKISDFGMSGSQKNTHGNSETIVKAMPIPWMAPEVLSVKKSDSGVQVTEFSTKSDVWSFGMVVYELLVGKPPHHEIDRRQEHQLAERIIKEGFTPEIPSDCPDLLRDIMQKCWQKDPAERPTMKEVCAMLKSSSAPNSMTF